jgi:hypothetical protein
MKAALLFAERLPTLTGPVNVRSELAMGRTEGNVTVHWYSPAPQDVNSNLGCHIGEKASRGIRVQR